MRKEQLMEPMSSLGGLKKILLMLPFFALVEGDKEPKLNMARVVEAIIIATVAGLLSAYITMREIGIKVEGMTSEIQKLDARVFEHRLWHLEKAEKSENFSEHPKEYRR